MLHLDEDTFRELQALSDEESRSIEEIVVLAVKRYEAARFWAKAKEGFERLRADPVAWKEYQDEIALWDSLSADGLENEPPYFTEDELRNMEVIDAVVRDVSYP
jgi:hypothetical protein